MNNKDRETLSKRLMEELKESSREYEKALKQAERRLKRQIH
jgi:hypothetical protein